MRSPPVARAASPWGEVGGSHARARHLQLDCGRLLRRCALGDRVGVFLVLMDTYIGMGALTHDFGLSSWWFALSTLLVWAAPAQVILISAFGTGAAPIEVAIAVSLSAIRLFPMVLALMPLLRGPGTRLRDLLLPTHFSSVSMWVESLRLLPGMPRERRLAFCNGLSVGYMATAMTFGFCRLLPRGRPAAAVCRNAAVSDADVVSDFDRAQQPENGGPAGAGAGPHARPVADLMSGST
jgi:AzlC protein